MTGGHGGVSLAWPFGLRQETKTCHGKDEWIFLLAALREADEEEYDGDG